MKQLKQEFMTRHLLVLCAMSIIGALVRNAVMKYGFDTFNCNLVFVISTTILMVSYIKVSNGINKLTEEIDGEDINLEDVTFEYSEEASPTYSNYEQLRQEALEAKAKKEKNILDSAINYTRKTFAAYMKEEHLNQLCEYITLFHSCTDAPKNPHALKVDKSIRTIDLLHYAWNVGNIFKKKGIYTATFIKRAFAEALDDVEITTIIRKLRMEGTCIIELKPNLVA